MNPGQKIVLKGIAASPGGKISGRVRIVSSPQELEKLEEGYILVSSFLTPVFMSSIKKIPRVSGIVTDKGGATCHAAIFARELKIPYVAGTIDATLKLKNNARVVMDSDKGIVYEI